MHIVTYKNGMIKNIKSKTAIRLKHFVYGRTHICLLVIVNVTYLTHCYDMKSNTVLKSWKNHVTHKQNGTLYFLIMAVRVSW